eukprot:21754-Hanusia_phi.AAC.1
MVFDRGRIMTGGTYYRSTTRDPLSQPYVSWPLGLLDHRMWRGKPFTGPAPGPPGTTVPPGRLGVPPGR